MINCRYPLPSKYTGRGSTSDAENCVCAVAEVRWQGHRLVAFACALLALVPGQVVSLGAQSPATGRTVNGPPVPQTEPARIELWSLASTTMTDDAFLTGQRNGQPTTLAAELRLPSAGTERVPVVVLLHGSGGVSANHDRWVRELNGLGIATLLVDSFTGRGITTTVEDQSQLGQMAMIYDAYRALELLAGHPRIDPSRIGLFGNSRGGVGALYASVMRFQRMYAPADATFAVYISLYPPCTREYIDDTAVADRPIRLYHGTSDLIAPIERCRAYVRRLQAAGEDVQLTEYAGAHHGFDSHRLPPRSGDHPGVMGQTCELREEPAGRFVNRATGRPVTAGDACLKGERITGYDAGAHAKVVEDVTRVLRRVFRLEPSK
jgi:dienelactone hydrolase